MTKSQPQVPTPTAPSILSATERAEEWRERQEKILALIAILEARLLKRSVAVNVVDRDERS